MYSKQVSLCNVLLFVVLAALTLNDVSAISCYSCTTENDPRCRYTPSQYKTCYAAATFKANENEESTPILNALVASPASNVARYEAFNCGTFKVEYKGQTHIVRSCTEKNLTCEDYAQNLANHGMTLKSCQRCYTNFCNYYSI